MATDGKFQLIISSTEECAIILSQIITEFPELSIKELHKKLLNTPTRMDKQILMDKTIFHDILRICNRYYLNSEKRN